MSHKKASFYFFILLLILTGSLSLVAGRNGDMPFYIATAITQDGKTDQEAIAGAKSVILSEITGREAESILSRLENADKNILDFYRIKPLYVTIIRILHHFGFSYITATLIPSLISFFLIGSLVFYWSIKMFKPWPALVFSTILMLMNPSIILARLSSPDPISNLLLLICLYRIYFMKKYFWTVLILICSLFVRLDNIISVCVLITLMRVWPEKNMQMPIRPYILFLVLAILFCLGINYHFESDFWWFRKVTYLRSPQAYGIQVLIYFLSVSQSFLPSLLLMCSIAFFYRLTAMDKKQTFMLAGIACIILVRFLFFPSFEERFFTAYYLSGFLLVMELLTKKVNEETTPLPNPPVESLYHSGAMHGKDKNPG